MENNYLGAQASSYIKAALTLCSTIFIVFATFVTVQCCRRRFITLHKLPYVCSLHVSHTIEALATQTSISQR